MSGIQDLGSVSTNIQSKEFFSKSFFVLLGVTEEPKMLCEGTYIDSTASTRAYAVLRPYGGDVCLKCGGSNHLKQEGVHVGEEAARGFATGPRHS